MNRLQKKCFLATAGVHLLLLVILIVGSAFFQPRSSFDNPQVLDVIPAHLIDAAFNSGVRNTQPPKPAEQQPVYQPPVPPVVTPRPPTPAPERVVKPKRVEPKREQVKPNLTRVERPIRTEPHKIKVNLKPVVRGGPNRSQNTRDDSQRAVALRRAIRSLRHDFSDQTTVDMPGNSSAAYANYGAVVVSVYRHAWLPPNVMESDSAMVKFTVTIASDGTVISARITEPSGDLHVDSAVRRLLDRVTFIAPFPEDSTDKERTYTINFNATRQMLE